jgi:hypothetical protein
MYFPFRRECTPFYSPILFFLFFFSFFFFLLNHTDYSQSFIQQESTIHTPSFTIIDSQSYTKFHNHTPSFTIIHTTRVKNKNQQESRTKIPIMILQEQQFILRLDPASGHAPGRRPPIPAFCAQPAADPRGLPHPEPEP